MTAVYTFIVAWFRIKNTIFAVFLRFLFLWFLNRLFPFFFRFHFSSAFRIENIIDLFFKLIEKALEPKIVHLLLFFLFHDGLIGFANLGEFCGSFRWGIILWMVFNSHFTIGIFYLIQRRVIFDVQNLVSIEFFLNRLRIVFSKELSFLFSFNFIFLEKLFKKWMRVTGLFGWIVLWSLNGSRIDSQSKSRASNSLEREEGVMHIKERSDEESPHSDVFLVV